MLLRHRVKVFVVGRKGHLAVEHSVNKDPLPAAHWVQVIIVMIMITIMIYVTISFLMIIIIITYDSYYIFQVFHELFNF